MKQHTTRTSGSFLSSLFDFCSHHSRTSASAKRARENKSVMSCSDAASVGAALRAPTSATTPSSTAARRIELGSNSCASRTHSRHLSPPEVGSRNGAPAAAV